METFGTDGETIQLFTVATSGEYEISAAGAAGGGSEREDVSGGDGAAVTGEIYLEAGTVLGLVIGVEGQSSLNAGGGGGGGTYVFDSDGLLLAAGGGGGASGNYAGGDGLSGPTGGDAGGFGGGDGGEDGAAGEGATSGLGGGGGGFTGGDAGQPGMAEADSFAGGEGASLGPNTGLTGGDGGFGGGGAGGGDEGGGGGGGYGGGGGGGSVTEITANSGGGGGGSYVDDELVSDDDEIPGLNGGDGLVILELACYLIGTRILTVSGAIEIEKLATGDRVITASGAVRPIKWLGHRDLDLTKHAKPRDVWPVRVAAHAFGDNLPLRDLWLSPGHSIAVGGALIPIASLINGVSIAQMRMSRADYWHIELDTHDVILAEGLAAETYLDTGNRTAFANGGAFVEAHPDFEPKHWAETCLPLVKDGPPVVRTKTRLLARLAEQGDVVTQEADAHVMVDGERIAAIALSPTRLAFLLPADGRNIELRSNVFVPAHMAAESIDTRELGLCVGRLRIDGWSANLDSDEACGEGWRQAEVSDGRFAHRWTTGAARLPSGARVVIVDLASPGRYWRRHLDRAAALTA